MRTGFHIRESEAGDIPAITGIYAHYVQHGTASFELEPPDEAETARRREAVLAGGYPYLVAVDGGGGILGYAYAGPYRTRPAYRFACEDSIYVAPGAAGLGVGRALLAELIRRCDGAGLRLMVAVIGGSDNAASIGLHRSSGFEGAGVLPNAGWKHGRWIDSVLMTRSLGAGATAEPVERTVPVPPRPCAEAPRLRRYPRP